MCLSTATSTVIQKRPIRPIIEFNERKLWKRPKRETYCSLPCAWAQPHAQGYKRDPYDLQKRPTKENYERDLHERLTFHYHVPEHTATRTVIWIIYNACEKKNTHTCFFMYEICKKYYFCIRHLWKIFFWHTRLVCHVCQKNVFQVVCQKNIFQKKKRFFFSIRDS